MSLAVKKADFFKQDYAKQFAWYVDEAGTEVAWRFQAVLDQTLKKLARQLNLGRRRRFLNPRLHGLRSFQVGRPFNKVLVFYRAGDEVLDAVRLMHGARDLPRRLVEPPEGGAA